MAVLFPKMKTIDTIAKIALSLGISMAIVPLIGLIHNYTSWGITLGSVLYSTASFVFILSIVAWYRRRMLPEWEKATIEFRLSLPGWSGNLWDKISIVILIVSVVGVLGGFGYVIFGLEPREPFTEFLILGPEARMKDYPTEFLISGGEVVHVRYGDNTIEKAEKGNVILRIINHEHTLATYIIRVIINGEQISTNINGNELFEVGPIKLNHEETWEHEIGFVPELTEGRQKIEFVLYKNGIPIFEDPLYLIIDVKIQG